MTAQEVGWGWNLRHPLAIIRSMVSDTLRIVMASLALAACASGRQSPPPQTGPEPQTSAGVLIMAHGGDAAWDAAVRAAVAPLADRLPVEIAFGMADPATLQGGVSALEARGVTRIAVVRLFVSRLSFLHQTEYLLGLRSDPPAAFVMHGGLAHGGPAPAAVTRTAEVRVGRRGLAESPVIGTILRGRVAGLSRDPRNESVLVLGHGVGDDAENTEVLAALNAALDSIRATSPFRAVLGEMLREDWPEKRAEAEGRIRAFVRDGMAAGEVLVVPFRLFGFGSYDRVLDGMVYRADGLGLLPHPLIADWIRGSAAEVFCDAGWESPLGACEGAK